VKSTQKNNLVGWFKRPLYHYLKQVLVPCKVNHYRPHVRRRHGLLGILVFVIAIQVGNFSTVNAVEATTPTTAEVLLNSTNNERKKQQLGPLALNDTLSQAANLKAQDMLKQQYWAHIAPDGSTPWKWFKEVGYSYSYAGENLAKNFHTPDAVMAAWMASPEHKANILDGHYSEVGFASVDGTLDGQPVQLTVALYGAPLAAGAMVATSAKETSTLAGSQMGIMEMERLNTAAKSMSFMSLGPVLLLLTGGAVAVMAHLYREKLPKKFRASWYKHHGLLKAGGMLSLCFIIVFLYTSGQI
jgi:uncharacterized protein YkwD